MYTNEGLVKHAEKALELKTKYMWGGILRPITAEYVNMLSGIYGAAQYSASRIAALKKLENRGYYGVDCVGLVKSYYWSGKPNGGTGSPNYGKAGFPDVNANAMFAAARVKGKIDTMPEIPGLVVYCRSRPHVGVYAGDGKVIESTLSSKGDGVIQTNLKDWIWEYWFECPYIEYPEISQKPSVTNTPQKKETETRVIAYLAAVRAKPSTVSARLGTLKPGEKAEVFSDSEAKYITSAKTYTYVKIKWNGNEAWIVKSSLK